MAEATSATRGHYIFGGSNADRNWNCKGNIALKILKDIPNQPESNHATEGTEFHDLIEILGKDMCELYNEQGILLGTTDISGALNQMLEFSDEMRGYAYDWFEQIIKDILELKPTKIFCERKVAFNTALWIAQDFHPELEAQLKKFKLELGAGGSLDFFFAFIKDDELFFYISDAKYGAGKLVEADTLQLLFYLCAAFDQYRFMFSRPDHPRKFGGGVVKIFQPRLEDDFSEVWRSRKYSAEEIAEWAGKFMASADLSLTLLKQPLEEIEKFHLNADPKPYGWCHFCDCQHQCAAYIGMANENAVLEFDELVVEADLSPTAPVETVAASFLHKLDSPEKLARFLEFIPILKSMINHVQGLAVEKLLNGEEIPGWKVVEGRSQRRFKKKEFDAVVKGLREIGIEEPFEPKLRGIGSIEKELKKLGVKNPATAIAPFVEKTVPGKSLAPEADSRRAITNENAGYEEFDEIEL